MCYISVAMNKYDKYGTFNYTVYVCVYLTSLICLVYLSYASRFDIFVLINL